jgi:hypothetical protein
MQHKKPEGEGSGKHHMLSKFGDGPMGRLKWDKTNHDKVIRDRNADPLLEHREDINAATINALSKNGITVGHSHINELRLARDGLTVELERKPGVLRAKSVGGESQLERLNLAKEIQGIKSAINAIEHDIGSDRH